MLFLPQSLYDARRRLWRDFEAGKITAEQAYQKMLDLDPYDHIGMIGLGRLRREAGDLAKAEEYFWRAIQAHPCMSAPYLELAQTLDRQPGSEALSEALSELGIEKRAFNDEAFLEGLDFEEAGFDGEALEEFKKLPGATQAQLISKAVRANRDHEPEAAAKCLRPLRLLQQMQEEGDLDPETVDAIVADGESIVPLLVGVARGWAQDLLGEDADGWVENALALLGETGSASEIPHLLEFVGLEHEDAAGAARWALGRIFERHTAEAAQFVGSITAGLGPAERLAVAEQIIYHPNLDPAGNLLKRLSENLEALKKAHRDTFFLALLTAMAAARGMEGVKLGRAALHQRSGLLSRDARRECEALLAALTEGGVEHIPMEPSPVTVYDICAGNAEWGEDDEDEDEEERLLPAQEPVSRKPAPGRNDPCWCNSGKKYKKCHLESDERRDGRTSQDEPLVPHTPNEFDGLRKRIGQFLGQALPERDVKLAIQELFGDRAPDTQDANLTLSDWMLHDWVAPSLGRTALQEFLVRRGSGLTQREREMVEAWSGSFIGFYEVQELKAGLGLKLKDLILGETFFVHDVRMSTQVARWDGLIIRVVPGERGTEFTGSGLTVPRHSIEELRLWMEVDRREMGWREYMKANWPRVRRRSFKFAADWMDSLHLANTDGEELLFSKAVYRAIDEAAARERLRGCPELQTEFDNNKSNPAETREYFVWLDECKTVLGNIRIASGELVLDCNSRQRMERGKLLLATVAGGWLRHLRDEFTTQKELKSRAAAAPRGDPPPQPEIPKEVRDEAIGSFLEKHYGTWPDTKLPALNGKTPREAARTAKGRKQVIEVLKNIENGEDRKRRAGEPSYDVARLRADLGLDS
jgi:hypothetical protein